MIRRVDIEEIEQPEVIDEMEWGQEILLSAIADLAGIATKEGGS